MSNLLLAAAIGLLGRWWEPLYLFAGAQLVLGAFNLLPALPLDGGRILWLALAWLTEPYTAQRVLSVVSLAVSLALLLGGGWFIWRQGGSPFLLVGAVGLTGWNLREIKLAWGTTWKKECAGRDALFALESGEPITDFDIVAFSVGYEMAFPAILNMLDLAGIPIHSAERTGLTPLVIAGGTAMYNAEPIADFIDLVSLGEGEDITVELVELHRKARREGWSKMQFLRAAAQLPGIYVTLSSLSTSDYPPLTQLCDQLEDFCQQRHVNLSLPSLRADNFSMNLMERLAKGRKSGLTFAPEAGTQRLRDVINKNVTQEDLLQSCRTAFAGGYNAVKLYFMLGLPTETDVALGRPSRPKPSPILEADTGPWRPPDVQGAGDGVAQGLQAGCVGGVFLAGPLAGGL